MLEKINKETQEKLSSQQIQQEVLEQLQIELQRAKKQIENRDQEIQILRKETQQLNKDKNALKEIIGKVQIEHQKFRTFAEARIKEFLTERTSYQKSWEQNQQTYSPAVENQNELSYQYLTQGKDYNYKNTQQEVINFQTNQILQGLDQQNLQGKGYYQNWNQYYEATDEQNEEQLIFNQIPEQQNLQQGWQNMQENEQQKESYGRQSSIERQRLEQEEKAKEVATTMQENLFEDVGQVDFSAQNKQYDFNFTGNSQVEQFQQNTEENENYWQQIQNQQEIINVFESKTAEQDVFQQLKGDQVDPQEFFNTLQDEVSPQQNVNWFD